VKTILLLFALLTGSMCVAQTPEEKLSKLNIELPKLGEPMASYVHYVRVGNLLYLSGKGPQNAAGEYTKGKLGKELTVDEGYAAARLTAINQIAVLKMALGDLSKVKRIVKVNGFVNSEPNFYDHPKVINGFSDLMVEVFGEKGRHARTSLGVSALPVNMAVEIEVIVEVE
jgi:enamine deaminase RidA (YjgF/YER057c/UK114 family)